MYLRQIRRTNWNGSVVSYLLLAHNERHPDTGVPTAKVIHNFGRADKVDRAGLHHLVSSISRFLDPEQAVLAAAGGQVEVLDSRRASRRLGLWIACGSDLKSVPRSVGSPRVAGSMGRRPN